MITKKIFDNNLVLIYEKLPHVRSVCIGIWFKVGSINEDDSNRGISHLIEHMLFKGTKNRSAKDIANELDNIGGQLNAFTSKEVTCFYAKTLQEDIKIASDVLGDMILNSTFKSDIIKREKQVVMEEIAMYSDSPEDNVHEQLEENIWKDHPLSYPISGYKKTVQKITKKQIVEYMDKYYRPDNMVISVVGNFDEKYLIKCLQDTFEKFKGNATKFITKKPQFYTCNKVIKKEIEQTYLSIAFNAYGYEDDRRFALLAASNILGGGMSSKLFQHVREEKGLVYSIGSTIEAYQGCGIVEIYAGMNEENLDEVLKCIEFEINEIKNNGVTQDEVNKAKQQLKSGLIMGLESTTARMNSNARSMIQRNKIFNQDQLREKIDLITIEDINNVINDVFLWDKKAVSIVTSK